jgi:glycosyltransferase involved in cell wall biosynthesis
MRQEVTVPDAKLASTNAISVTPQRQEVGAKRPYRFGFVLNVSLGNMTRYLNLRKYAERDPEIDCIWAPVSHYTPPEVPSRLRFLPDPLFMRARVLQQAKPVLTRLAGLDALMMHLFEAELICSLRSYFAETPLLISSTDEAPMVDRSRYPLYPSDLRKPVWRQKLRLALDFWKLGRTDFFIPFSQWAADILVQGCSAPAERVRAIHVGLDLDVWSHVRSVRRAPTTKILFVGGDFVRKGGGLLLEVFEKEFRDSAELHLVSRQAPKNLPPRVYVHDDYLPNDPRFIELYTSVDMLVVPTTADTGPLWVFMEAMAMGLPVIGTDTGSNPELVRQGETGYMIPVGDGASLAQAIRALSDDAEIRQSMGRRGRELIERKYNAAVNVPLILRCMKDAVDARGARTARGG